MRRIAAGTRESIKRATMPLFRTVAGKAGVCATGVLLAIQGKQFILTAAHIFDGHHWDTRPIPLSITDRVLGKPLFPIGDVTMRRSPTKDPVNRFDDDPFDSCVIDISQETATRIAAGSFRFLELSDLDPWGDQDLCDLYTVAGYPDELDPGEVAPNALGEALCCYTTVLYWGDRGEIPWTEDDQGVGILMDHGQDTTQDDNGQSVVPPWPTGMSGGGLWRIAASGSDMNAWNLADVKLIGIQSRYYIHESVLRGTRIEHSLGFIYRGHKDLQPVFEDAFGEAECQRRWRY